MDGVSIRPQVQECRDRGLKLLSTKRADLVLNQFVCGEALSGEKVCVAHSIQYKQEGSVVSVRWLA